jgi:hypothetical protein
MHTTFRYVPCVIVVAAHQGVRGSLQRCCESGAEYAVNSVDKLEHDTVDTILLVDLLSVRQLQTDDASQLQVILSTGSMQLAEQSPQSPAQPRRAKDQCIAGLLTKCAATALPGRRAAQRKSQKIDHER